MYSIPFKVYYRDGSSYVGDPEKAPILGVALIVQFSKENGREIVSHGDYYCWYQDRWQSCGYDSMIAYMSEPGWKKYLIGVQIYQDDWDELNRLAESDPDFPARTARSAREKYQARRR